MNPECQGLHGRGSSSVRGGWDTGSMRRGLSLVDQHPTEYLHSENLESVFPMNTNADTLE